MKRLFKNLRLAYLEDMIEDYKNTPSPIRIFKGPARIKEDLLNILKPYIGEPGWTNTIKRSGYNIIHEGELSVSKLNGSPSIRNDQGRDNAEKYWTFPTELMEGCTLTVDFNNRLINTDLKSQF